MGTIDSVVMAVGCLHIVPKYDRKDDWAYLGTSRRVTKMYNGRLCTKWVEGHLALQLRPIPDDRHNEVRAL